MPIIIDGPSGLPVPRRTDKAPRNRQRGRVPGPEDIRQVSAETLRDPGLHATPEDFGAGVARAVEDLGAKAAGIALAFDEKRRQAEDDTAGIAGIADARVRFPKVAQEMEARADKADGFTANLGPALAAETDAILRDLRDVRGLRHSDGAEDAIRTQLHMLASRMVARGAKFEQGARLSQLGIEVDAAVRNLAMAAFNSPGDWPAIMEETESRLARFKDKLPPDILAAKVAAARETIALNATAGLIELDPALALRGLKEGVFDDDLPAADRKRLRARAKAAQRARRAQAELGQSRDRAAAGADGARRLVVLEGAIGRGEADEQAIAEAADILDQPTRARLHENLDTRRADDAARNRRIETVSAALAGRAPATGEGNGKPDGGGDSGDGDLRPGAPGWRQAVDDHYASLAPALETMDPDTRARFEDDYARATGVLPDAVAKTLRGGLLSADPAGQAVAATRLARLKDVDPALVSAIPANERRRAQAIAEFVDLGLPPARAVELADEKLADGAPLPQDLIGGVSSALEGSGDEVAPGRNISLPPGMTEAELIQRIEAFSEKVQNLALGEPDGRVRGEKPARPDAADAGGSPLIGPGGEGQPDEKPGKPRPPAVTNAGPPTNKPVVLLDMYNKLGFDPIGIDLISAFANDSIPGAIAGFLVLVADVLAQFKRDNGDFGTGSKKTLDLKQDAFRHAYWSYLVTQLFSADLAKGFGDAHEISTPTPAGDRLMDLYNNNAGRKLALDPANKGRPADEVILEALRQGQLQTRWFAIKSP